MSEKEMIDEMRKIEKILADNKAAEAPKDSSELPKEMVEELKKIESLLAENQKAESPALPKDSANNEPPKAESPEVPKYETPQAESPEVPKYETPQETSVDAQAIKEAETQSKDVTNQLTTVNANLEALLTEVQGLATTMQQLTS